MKIAIIGTVGVPGRYGGFETLAENLVLYAQKNIQSDKVVTVYCSAKAYPKQLTEYHGAELRYSRFNANGVQSIIYDISTAINAAFTGHDRLLVLGVSGAIIFPVLRLFSRAKIIVNVDGIEWRRDKWKGIARHFLRLSEAIAVRFAHKVISDNQGIADYLAKTYNVKSDVIAYGGDHALQKQQVPATISQALPQHYALALCRIEPENNVEMILEAFEDAEIPLVFVGNWENSISGRNLKARFSAHPRLHLLDPVYEPGALFQIRCNASAYIHGHSAGGTNPALVEMMHLEQPIFAFDCNFNKYTTENRAAYFADAQSLRQQINQLPAIDNKDEMKEIAERLYMWDKIGGRYFSILR